MTSTINQQTARRKADQRLRAEFQERYAVLMQEEHEKMGLTYSPRLSAEEREEQKALAKRAKAEEKIRAAAEAAGLTVSIDVAPTEAEAAVLANEHVSNAIRETFEGTAETVEVDYRH